MSYIVHSRGHGDIQPESEPNVIQTIQKHNEEVNKMRKEVENSPDSDSTLSRVVASLGESNESIETEIKKQINKPDVAYQVNFSQTRCCVSGEFFRIFVRFEMCAWKLC